MSTKTYVLLTKGGQRDTSHEYTSRSGGADAAKKVATAQLTKAGESNGKEIMLREKGNKGKNVGTYYIWIEKKSKPEGLPFHSKNGVVKVGHSKKIGNNVEMPIKTCD